MNDDVEEFYIDSISNQSRGTSFKMVSGLKRAAFGGGFPCRIGIGFATPSFKIALP